MNAAVLDFDPSLRRAQHAFDHWRNSRKRRGPTPMALRECAVALLEQHCAFHVCRALRINANALKQWSDAQSERLPSETSADADGAMGFVRLPDTDEPTNGPAPQVAESLSIELPNEMVIHLPRTFTLDEVLQSVFRVGGHARIF